MSAAVEREELVADETVDESSLKVPVVKWDNAGPVKTGEEDEDAIYVQRCALFLFSGTEWKERGKGDVKLLKNKTTGIVRIVMRQEKTMKVRCNHKVDPKSVLVSHGGSDKAWVWSAEDYAGEKPAHSKFAIQVRNKEVAQEFKAAFESARETNKDLFARGVHGNAGAAAAPAAAAAGAVGGAGTGGAGTAASPAKPAAEKHVDTSGPVPATDSFEVIYGTGAGATDAAIRFGTLTEAFKREFAGSEPAFYVRAPGRVNLIGEHVDYHSYSVLPMALTQDVVIAVSTNFPGGPVKVANTNSAKYATATLPPAPAAPVDTSAGVSWHQYVHCGYKGAFDMAAEKGLKLPLPKGIYMMVDGRVPTGAGVSSSSALTVASLLAVAHANGIDSAVTMTRADLGEAARKCELYIGTMSGGMDQAISCLAKAGQAARIDFEPLKANPVSLPAGAVFVVSNTLEESVKAVDAEKRYNKRVTEGKLAAKLVAKGEGLAGWAAVQTLRQLQGDLKLAGPGGLLPAIEKHLRPGAYSVADLTTALGADPATLFEGDAKKAGALKVLSSVGADDKTFELLKRARHVASEAERVFAFQAACEGKVHGGAAAGGAVLEGGLEGQLKAMGALMNESHASCRDDYECSSEGLDALTALASASGAYGSRLTGAGWGGCAVSLVAADKVPAFLEALKAGYYTPRGKTGDVVSTALFTSAPGTGAAIYNPPTSFEI